MVPALPLKEAQRRLEWSHSPEEKREQMISHRIARAFGLSGQSSTICHGLNLNRLSFLAILHARVEQALMYSERLWIEISSSIDDANDIS